MSKRRINKQQQQRIREQQARKREKASTNLQVDSDKSLGPEQPGLVIAHYGSHVQIEDQQGQRHQCRLRQNIGAVVAGDQIAWCADKHQQGVVVALYPRKTTLARPDAYGKLKPIAANIDHIILVFAPAPTPKEILLDSYLVAAENLGITPTLLINKTDLITEQNQHLIDGLRELYQSLGYDVLQVSCTEAYGLKPLQSYLHEKTCIFVGQSGVGKSSLIAALLQDQDITIGAISETLGKGKHTTTTAKLYHLPQSGQIIDSPGIRDFELDHFTPEQVVQGFIEFRELVKNCKFRNCSHQKEIGCAVLDSLKNNEISQQRYTNFLRIMHKAN